MSVQAKLEHDQRLLRDFPGIEKEVDCLFYKHAGADTTKRLKLLWGFIKADQIDFKQFERLVALINNASRTSAIARGGRTSLSGTPGGAGSATSARTPSVCSTGAPSKRATSTSSASARPRLKR